MIHTMGRQPRFVYCRYAAAVGAGAKMGACAKRPALQSLDNTHGALAGMVRKGKTIMARSGGRFSDEEVRQLRALPAVANVTRNRITYSDTFRHVCTIRYLTGESPTKIFREAGLPPELIGYKRIERCVARWKESAMKTAKASEDMSDSEVIARLVKRFEHALAVRQSLDQSFDHIAGSLEAPSPALPARQPAAQRNDPGTQTEGSRDPAPDDVSDLIIKQQARRINELERMNAALRSKMHGGRRGGGARAPQ